VGACFLLLLVKMWLSVFHPAFFSSNRSPLPSLFTCIPGVAPSPYQVFFSLKVFISVGRQKHLGGRKRFCETAFFLYVNAISILDASQPRVPFRAVYVLFPPIPREYQLKRKGIFCFPTYLLPPIWHESFSHC